MIKITNRNHHTIARTFALFFLTGIVLLSCGQPEGFKKPEDALDCGREFLRSVLDGDYTRAEMYVLPEEEDIALFRRFRKYMKEQPEKERLGLKSASIQINKVEALNDSVSVINYANSYKKEPSDLRVIKQKGEWWVDFSYTFAGRALEDTLR